MQRFINISDDIPKILATHAVEHKIDAEIRQEELLRNALSDEKERWNVDFVLVAENSWNKFRISHLSSASIAPKIVFGRECKGQERNW